ncbi:MAG: hypothetical protein BWY85_00131 [Firmicutes bacterium ADurb.Bin506]|nr:MAG: hypothetical protein BWY85_00131 [Firmicutes bacterium ADurb.Bin506]
MTRRFRIGQVVRYRRGTEIESGVIVDPEFKDRRTPYLNQQHRVLIEPHLQRIANEMFPLAADEILQDLEIPDALPA